MNESVKKISGFLRPDKRRILVMMVILLILTPIINNLINLTRDSVAASGASASSYLIYWGIYPLLIGSLISGWSYPCPMSPESGFDCDSVETYTLWFFIVEISVNSNGQASFHIVDFTASLLFLVYLFAGLTINLLFAYLFATLLFLGRSQSKLRVALILVLGIGIVSWFVLLSLF